MSVIPTDSKKLSEVEDAVAKYACGEMKIAKDRVHNKVEQGGLGLIPLAELDIAIKCWWVNRWAKEGATVDFTGALVLNSGNGRVECIDYKRIGRDSQPCALNISLDWDHFRRKYYVKDDNILRAYVFVAARGGDFRC